MIPDDVYDARLVADVDERTERAALWRALRVLTWLVVVLVSLPIVGAVVAAAFFGTAALVGSQR